MSMGAGGGHAWLEEVSLQEGHVRIPLTWCARILLHPCPGSDYAAGWEWPTLPESEPS